MISNAKDTSTSNTGLVRAQDLPAWCKNIQTFMPFQRDDMAFPRWLLRTSCVYFSSSSISAAYHLLHVYNTIKASSIVGDML